LTQNGFIETASIAALLAILEPDDESPTLTDDQLIERIAEETHQIDPLEWPRGYELNDELVLASKDTGRVWVPPHDEDCDGKS
jgi:hypothetical protein